MARQISSQIVKEVQLLRSKGWTIPELSKKFSIGRATASRYSRGIKILPEFKSLWLSKRKGSIRRKEEAKKIATKKAETALMGNLSNKERLLILSSLYWAEGAKIDSNLTNTDPDLVGVFVKGVCNVIGIPKNRLRLNIRIYEDMDEQKCINYWLAVTGLGRNNLSSVNVLSGKKKGKLEYGMCRVRVTKGGDVLKYLVAVRSKIIEFF